MSTSPSQTEPAPCPRAMWVRVLPAWASDVLVLRRKGLLSPTWVAPEAVERGAEQLRRRRGAARVAD